MTSRAWYVWIMIVFATLWHAGGVVNFLMMQSAEMLSQMPEANQAFMKGQPLAAYAFALSVFAGLIGGILWLIRQSLAPLFFLIAALGAAITLVLAFGYGVGVWLPTLLSVVFALGCAWLARRFA